jgi:HD superfamily phosphohydrolase YqeK
MAPGERERARWLRAVWLHDALRDAPEEQLIRLAPDAIGPEELRHGPAAAVRAAEDGEMDAGVLAAVRYHSVGSAEWDQAGRVLYCADFLEPGRSFDPEARAELAARFPNDPAGVLYEVTRRRLLYAVRSGWTIPEETIRFWNRVVAGVS